MIKKEADWIQELPPNQYTIEDYDGGEARWCPGCGDFAVLSAVKRICRDNQIPPEKMVAVSGIGCSSRFPHYMNTYGFHGLHGRALPVACGIKARRPDLDIWVATGDGDCCSIGAGHWIHAIRYNMNITVMLFDNNVYGLTKNQSSPTSPQGLVTSTHPSGTWLPPLNPTLATLGFTNVSFVAQTVDWNPPHLYATLNAAYQHKGLSFVRIMQRCPTFTPNLFDPIINDPTRLILLTHENGIEVEPAVEKKFKNKVVHDPSDMTGARDLSTLEGKLAIGLLFHDPNTVIYDEFTNHGLDMDAGDKLKAVREEIARFAI